VPDPSPGPSNHNEGNASAFCSASVASHTLSRSCESHAKSRAAPALLIRPRRQQAEQLSQRTNIWGSHVRALDLRDTKGPLYRRQTSPVALRHSEGLFSLAHIFSSSEFGGGGGKPWIDQRSKGVSSMWNSQSKPRPPTNGRMT